MILFDVRRFRNQVTYHRRVSPQAKMTGNLDAPTRWIRSICKDGKGSDWYESRAEEGECVRNLQLKILGR
jgi:hypothetical protein